MDLLQHKIRRVGFKYTGDTGVCDKGHGKVSIQTFLEQLQAGRDSNYDLLIFFMPPIYSDTNNRDKKASPVLLDDPELCKRLTKSLRIDRFFLTENAWKSNGFFMNQQTGDRSDPSERRDVSRYLIKFLNDPAYSWLYLSFCVLTVNCKENKSCCNLVCFDDSSKIEDEIIEAFQHYTVDHIRSEPFAVVHDALLRVITEKYDNALWHFRSPIRDIEKQRRQFASKVATLMEQNLDNGEGLISDYDHWHNLSRHAIHTGETLQIAANTVRAILQSLESPSPRHGIETVGEQREQPISNNILNRLRFSSDFLANLKLRAVTFTERLENEIRLAYNVVSVHQLQDSDRISQNSQTQLQQMRQLLEGSHQQLLDSSHSLHNSRELLEQMQTLLEQTKDDGKELTEVVTWLTLIYLPATFAAGFFGMNFMGPKEDNTGIKVTHDIWIFVVAAIGLIIVSVILFAFFRHRARKTRISWSQRGSPRCTFSSNKGRPTAAGVQETNSTTSGEPMTISDGIELQVRRS